MKDYTPRDKYSYHEAKHVSTNEAGRILSVYHCTFCAVPCSPKCSKRVVTFSFSMLIKLECEASCDALLWP